MLSFKLERSDGGPSWGFRMSGGKDFGSPITVQRLVPGGLADKAGLQVGDEIKVIGKTQTENLRHNEAQQLIRDAGNLVELKVERGGSTAKVTDSEDTRSCPADVNANKQITHSQNQPEPVLSQVSSSRCVDISHTKAEVSSGITSNDDDFPPPPPLSEDVGSCPVVVPSLSGPSPAQSARHSEPQGSDMPQYQGYVDPSLQSRSFKLLQSAIESGEDISKISIRASSPARSASPAKMQKPAIGVKPVVPKDGAATAAKSIKPAAVSQQHNSPFGLYSEENIKEALEEKTKEIHQIHTGNDVVLDVPAERKTIVVPAKKTSTNLEPFPETIDVSMERKKIVIPSNKLPKTNSRIPDADKIDGSISASHSENGNVTKKYVPSETLKLIQDQESGRKQIQINPKTGAEIKMNQSKKLIKLEQNLEGGFASGPPPHPLATSYKVSSGVVTETGSGQPPPDSATRQANVGKPGEAKTLPAILEVLKIPVCVECGASIRGPYVTAVEKTWCPEHFVCANPSCRVPLIDCGFVEEGGQLYCEHDYEQHFAPKCGKCGLGIVGEVVSALQQKFHANCFVCNKCHLPISGGLFHTENGDLYCEKDWSIMFRTKCYNCQFPIDDGDPWVDAVSRMWHSDCFKCVICQVNLDGMSFYAKNGKPFCKQHGYA